MATTAGIFERPILHSPYEYPCRRWDLEASGQPTNRILLAAPVASFRATVMAMIIAWQTVNAVRRPGRRRLTRGFRVVTGGGTAARDRSVGHAVFPARVGPPRGNAVPVDGERLLADGRHRVRHREAAACAGGRQHPRRRDTEIPQLDSGEALDKNFRAAAGDEIERFRRETIQRTGDREEAAACHRASAEEAGCWKNMIASCSRAMLSARTWAVAVAGCDEERGHGSAPALKLVPSVQCGLTSSCRPWSASLACRPRSSPNRRRIAGRVRCPRA